MKTFLTAATVFLVCLLTSPLFAGDCSDVSSQIGMLKNKPGELRILADRAPECGEVWEALGDYFYRKKVWDEAYSHYEKALKYLPDKSRVSSRMQELRPKITTLIKSEKELLEYTRRIGGTTDSLPQSFAAAPQPAPVVEPAKPRVAPAQPAPKTVEKAPSASAKKGPEARIVLASKGASSPAQPARAKVDKVALMVHFQYNSAEITSDSKKLLDGFAEILNKELSGRVFVIQGHTDSQGARDYNLWLSQERAKSVRTYLSQRGVDKNRLRTQGFGFDKPIYDNETDSGRSKNRRVEFDEK